MEKSNGKTIGCEIVGFYTAFFVPLYFNGCLMGLREIIFDPPIYYFEKLFNFKFVINKKD